MDKNAVAVLKKKPFKELKGIVLDALAKADALIGEITDHIAALASTYYRGWRAYVKDAKTLTNRSRPILETLDTMDSALEMELDGKDFFIGLAIGGVGAALVPFSFMALTGTAAAVVLYGGSVASLGGFGWAAKDGPDVYRRSSLRKRVKAKIEEIDIIVAKLTARATFAAQFFGRALPPPKKGK